VLTINLATCSCKSSGQQAHVVCGVLLSGCQWLDSCCSTRLLRIGQRMCRAVCTPLHLLAAAFNAAALVSKHWLHAVRQHA
jgi:hypothetical protein